MTRAVCGCWIARPFSFFPWMNSKAERGPASRRKPLTRVGAIFRKSVQQSVLDTDLGYHYGGAPNCRTQSGSGSAMDQRATRSARWARTWARAAADYTGKPRGTGLHGGFTRIPGRRPRIAPRNLLRDIPRRCWLNFWMANRAFSEPVNPITEGRDLAREIWKANPAEFRNAKSTATTKGEYQRGERRPRGARDSDHRLSWICSETSGRTVEIAHSSYVLGHVEHFPIFIQKILLRANEPVVGLFVAFADVGSHRCPDRRTQMAKKA